MHQTLVYCPIEYASDTLITPQPPDQIATVLANLEDLQVQSVDDKSIL